ncbi:hypothetical protein P8A18_12720 [Streptomyces castrisilvae]|uniref:Uncharacterized protein n=1 Tax=Streptomyces castrisilvae TaxID=3033811 RepID=A0ABY9HI87_9ACTN|nr:hypothetical protein [Streptomyces sp. Mut1]WLQ34248.1 hypothetical protein P8A18_12720 [Streptomyces sp. Mut1]
MPENYWRMSYFEMKCFFDFSEKNPRSIARTASHSSSVGSAGE